MSEPVYIFTICLPFATILLVFGMRYLSAAQQARARFGNDEAYRLLAEKASATQAETALLLTSINARLAELALRQAAVEKMLKEVE